jgi:DNA-binding MarR family transcriptional regulator
MPLEVLSPIHKAGRQIGRYLEPRMGRLGLSNREAHLLSYLKAYGPCAIGELHTVFGHPRSTLTSMLDRLESNGLIAREIRREDRRSFVVGMTKTGLQRAERVQVSLLELEDRIRGRLGESDLDGFQKVMAAVAAVTSGDPKHKEEP